MSELVKKISEEVLNLCEKEPLCDWQHVIRVTRMAIKLAQYEKTADMEVVQLASLLHVLSKPVYNKNDIGLKQAVAFLKVYQVPHDKISLIVDILKNVHFQGSGVLTNMSSIEGKIVQDAHRLETLGAVGLAELFSEGIAKEKPLYTENEKIKKHISLEAYLNSKTSSIGTLHEELYLLKDKMNTLAAKRIAAKRHNFMKKFEAQFKMEWLGQDADPVIAKMQATSPWQDPYFQHFMQFMDAALKQPIKFKGIDFMAMPLIEDKSKK